MIEAVVIEVGNVRLIVVSGGDIPHIGAISFGNRSEENNRALGTHKELALTQKLFTRLKEVYSANLLITGGIHIDKISRKQVMESCDLLTDGIAKIIK